MSLQLDSKYWNQRYLDQDDPWDTGSITTPLKDYFDQLEDKQISILIPGAGNAYEAEYLMKIGFKDLSVCDFAAEPLYNLKSRCPLITDQNLIRSDFFELDGQFDLIVEQTFFCALDPALRRKYFQKMYALLKPGGKLVGLLFDDVLNKDKPPFGGTKQAYLNCLDPEQFEIRTFDPCYNSIKPRSGRELFINLVKAKARIERTKVRVH